MNSHVGKHYVVSLFHPFDEIVIVDTMRLVGLGENEIDRRLMCQSPQIKEAYMTALSFLNGDG